MPSLGRFLTRDTWDGDANRPMSYNRWSYVGGNPINYADPSGLILPGEESREAEGILFILRTEYNVNIIKDWGYRFDVTIPYSLVPIPGDVDCYWRKGNWRNISELELTLKAVGDMATAMGGPGRFRAAMKGQTTTLLRSTQETILDWGALTIFSGIIIIPNDVFENGEVWGKGTIVHELSHVWDYWHRFMLSSKMNSLTKSHKYVCQNGQPKFYNCSWVYDATIEGAPTIYAGPDQRSNPREDWSESVTVYVYPEYKEEERKSSSGEISKSLGEIRKSFIRGVIMDLPISP